MRDLDDLLAELRGARPRPLTALESDCLEVIDHLKAVIASVAVFNVLLQGPPPHDRSAAEYLQRVAARIRAFPEKFGQQEAVSRAVMIEGMAASLAAGLDFEEIDHGDKGRNQTETSGYAEEEELKS